jgi:hypothetical protein
MMVVDHENDVKQKKRYYNAPYYKKRICEDKEIMKNS